MFMPVPAVSLSALLLAVQAVPPVRGQGSVELTDPAGDVRTGGAFPARDLVKLSVRSDGTHLTVAATLAERPQDAWASIPLTLAVDTDNNPATGGVTGEGQAGFERLIELTLCLDYEGDRSACGRGGFPNAAVIKRAAAGAVSRLNPDRTQEPVRDALSAPQAPVQGAALEVRVSYGDLGVKAGQVVRIAAKEMDQEGRKNGFPDIVLTLK